MSRYFAICFHVSSSTGGGDGPVMGFWLENILYQIILRTVCACLRFADGALGRTVIKGVLVPTDVL